MSIFKNKYANDIFISYRHKGGIIAANHLAEKLKKDGYKVTFDKESLHAGPFPKQIYDYIHGCKDFIVILDENVFEKTLRDEPNDWLRIELAHAILLKKNIIPITLKDYKEPKEQLPKDIAEIVEHQHIMYDVENFDSFYAKLCSKDFLKSNNLFKKYWKYAAGFIAFLFALTLMFYTGEQIQSKQTKLLFVGGGSVANLIDELAGQEVGTSFLRKYTNSMYLNLPTKKAWTVLEEEACKERNIRELNGYIPICLSADTLGAAYADSIPNKCSDFKSVIGIELGVDPLTVFVKNDSRFITSLKISQRDTVIKIENLSNIIKQNEQRPEDFNIWATSSTSGTLLLYNDLLTDIDLVSKVEQEKTKRFYDNSPSTTINKDKIPYVILGSNYYYPKFLNKEDYLKLTIEGANSNLSSKPMYLYFVAYQDDKNTNNAIIPEPIIDFLKAIHAENFIKEWDKLKDGTYPCDSNLTILEKK